MTRPVVPDNGEQVTGFRIALVFEGGVPEVSAPEVKALLDPIIDFGVKNSREAYAQTLPPFLKDAIDHHDVLVGMNRRMVIASAGAPESKVRELVPGSETDHYEEWIYGRVPQTVRFVRIENDRVTQVRIAALGQPIAVEDGERDAGLPRSARYARDRDGRPPRRRRRRRPACRAPRLPCASPGIRCRRTPRNASSIRCRTRSSLCLRRRARRRITTRDSTRRPEPSPPGPRRRRNDPGDPDGRCPVQWPDRLGKRVN